MLNKSGIIYSFALGLILLAAAICTVIPLIWTGTNNELISIVSDNWLLKIFKSHSNIIDPGTDLLTGINFYDISILSLFALVCLSLSAKHKNLRIWFIIAFSLLILGIAVFIITQLAGRSSFMASGLIVSVLMLTKEFQNKMAGATGIIANALLLTGDFTVGAGLKIISVLFGLGYILLIIWIFNIANILTRNSMKEIT